jgi:hypothetical protein
MVIKTSTLYRPPFPVRPPDVGGIGTFSQARDPNGTKLRRFDRETAEAIKEVSECRKMERRIFAILWLNLSRESQD